MANAVSLPLLAVISACTFHTHCKTKTTPTKRSNVFTGAISKFPLPISAQYPDFLLLLRLLLESVSVTHRHRSPEKTP